MAFQAEQKIKTLILNTLGIDHIFRLLNDNEISVLMKTLGLLRNLLCTKPHIDYIMSLHGTEIIRVSMTPHLPSSNISWYFTEDIMKRTV